MCTARRPRPTLIALLLLGAAWGLPGEAQAKGTFFLLELNSGVAESAYVGGSAGFGYGASGGITLRIPGTPLRYHLLGSVMNRGSSQVGISGGAQFVAQRSDLDLFAANRFVLPVWRMIRLYGELGLGTRLSSTQLQRGGGLEGLTQRSQQLLVVTALGVQARVSERFSLGLRAELTPLGSGPDLTDYATTLVRSRNRIAAFAQVGVHL